MEKSKGMTERDQQEIKDKLEEVQTILSYLASYHNVDYCLNYSKTEENGITTIFDELMYNSRVDPDIVTFYGDKIRQLRAQMDAIPNLVKTGSMIVVCHDDTNKPEDIGDWPKKGQHYDIERAIKTADGGYCFQLRGLKTNLPYHGYNGKRFTFVRVKEWNN